MRIKLQFDSRWAELFQHFLQALLDFVRILIGNQPATELGARLGWQDRLGPFALITAPETVDVKRWPGPTALQRRETLLASQLLNPQLSPILLIRETKRGKLFALAGVDILDFVVKTGNLHPTVFVNQR